MTPTPDQEAFLIMHDILHALMKLRIADGEIIKKVQEHIHVGFHDHPELRRLLIEVTEVYINGKVTS